MWIMVAVSHSFGLSLVTVTEVDDSQVYTLEVDDSQDLVHTVDPSKACVVFWVRFGVRFCCCG